MKLKFFFLSRDFRNGGLVGCWRDPYENDVLSNSLRNIVLEIELKSYEIFKYRTFDTVICFPRGLLDSMETEASRALVAGIRRTTVEFYCIPSVSPTTVNVKTLNVKLNPGTQL